MGKLAVLVFAALAFHAAFAGVTRQYKQFGYPTEQIGEYQYGKFDEYTTEIRSVVNDLSVYLQNAAPNKYVAKTIIKQSHELAQIVEEIFDKLQEQTDSYSVEVDSVVQQVLRELKQIQDSLQQITLYTDVSSASQLKYQFNTIVQHFAQQIEKLVYLVQANPIESQGSLYTTIYRTVADFLVAIRKTYTQVQYIDQAIEGEQYPKELAVDRKYQDEFYGQNGYEGLYGYHSGLFGQRFYKYKSGKGFAMQIQSIASDFSAALQNVYLDNVVVRKTLAYLVREYVQEIEMIADKLEQISYTREMDVVPAQQIAQNLRSYVASFQQLINSEYSTDVYELKNQLQLFVQNVASELQKLTYGVHYDLEQTMDMSYMVVKRVFVQFLTATRNFLIQVQSISRVARRGQTTSGFGIQIQTLANGLTATLESLSVDNVHTRQILVEQTREFAQHLEDIIEKLQSVNYNTVYGADVPQQVAAHLRKIVYSFQQVADVEDVTFAQKVKVQLISNIQDAATQIQKLLWVGQNYLQQGQEQYFNAGFYAIYNDFVAALQNQQIQLQNVYQYNQYGQNTPQLALQIQAITNNLAVYFQRVPYKSEQEKQQIYVQARRLAQNIENIIERLEAETAYTTENVLEQVVSNLRQIVVSLEQVTEYETSVSVYELSSRFYVVLQNVASEMKKLAYVAHYNTQEVQGHVNKVVRSVLIQYLVVVQRIQVQLQGFNQITQIGQNPKELALQVQMVAQRISKMLRIVPDNRQTQYSLVYQARRFSQIIEVIANKLQVEATKENGNKYYVFQQVANNLNQIQMALQQVVSNIDVVSPYQLKIQLATRIQDAAVEIQKLMFVGQYDAEQGQDSFTTLARSALVEFLSGLQNLQMQVQDNLQIVFNGQHPTALVMQIQTVANRLSAYLQYVQPSNLQFRQTVVIQIGELAQTIENVIHMLQTEIKNYGEHSTVLRQITAELKKISLSLQQVNGIEHDLPIAELSAQFNANVQYVVAEIQKLAYIAQYKIQQTQVGDYNNGMLNGVFNNVLATLRNIFIQFQSFRQAEQYGQSTKQLANQIETVTNHLAQSLQIVGVGAKQVKQALAIEALKYARRVQNIVDRLETEVSYYTENKVNALQQIVQNLKQVVVVFQQIGESIATSATTDIRMQLIAQIQNAEAQIQKLLIVQSTFEQTQGNNFDTTVKSVLIEYLAAVQNFQIRVHNIAHVSQKGQTLQQLALQIETAVIDFLHTFDRVYPNNKLVAQFVTIEARQLAQVISSIVNKLQYVSQTERTGPVEQIASQLKQIQLYLQQIAGEETFANVYQQLNQFEVIVQRAAMVIQQLAYTVQPELYQVQANTGIVSLIKEVLNDFLAVVQNVHIQIQNAAQEGQTHDYALAMHFQAQRYGENPTEYYGELEFYAPYASQQEFLGKQFYGKKMFPFQTTQSPKMYFTQIRNVVNELSATLQKTALNNQQAKQIVAVQTRQLIQVIENIVDQLQEQINNDIDVAVAEFQQIIYNLREVQQYLRKIVGYTTFTTVYQLRTELDNYIQKAASQMEKLVYIAQQTSQGKLDMVIRNVLNTFLRAVQRMQMEIQTFAQYGQYEQYEQKYNNVFGYAGQYGKQYQYADALRQYNTEYGYPAQYGKQYKYADKFRQYDTEYGYPAQYKQYKYADEPRQYDTEYGYLAQYGKQYKYAEEPRQYEVEYGYPAQYGKQYKYADKLRQYDIEYKYPAQYDNEYKYDYQLPQYGYKHQPAQYGLGYSYQAQTPKQLVGQLQTFTNQVAEKIQTVATNDKQFRQIAIYQARQLVQIIENIVDKLEVEINGYGYAESTVQQVIRSLRQIQGELKQIIASGVISTVHQIKAQFVSYIQTVAAELNKLAVVVQSDVNTKGTFSVKNVLVQYITYLRNVLYQAQDNTFGQIYAYGRPQYFGNSDAFTSDDYFLNNRRVFRDSIFAY